MVVGGAELVLSLVVAHEFQGAVGDDLVGVHVDGGSCPALHHVDRELVVEFPIHNFLAGCDDGVGDLAVQDTQAGVCLGGGHLDVCHCDDIFRVVAHPCVGNPVIVQSPLGLDAVVGVSGDLEFTQEVAFDAVFDVRHCDID